ncbi:MAG: serine hydrolase [Chloracidobacterium sp.]|nr:serine hydrolase [Chloracidobacterium sp.]
MTERLLKPVGMKNTSWRDDFKRIVPGRAQAYSKSGDGPWQMNMPLMNAHGGGGMLTTVGDWLKWNAMLDAKTWNPSLVNALETQGVLNSGQKISYALGLTVGNYKGNRQVAHGGATAGYRTVLARYPDKRVSIAVLCNGTEPNVNELAQSFADEILGPFAEQPAENSPVPPIENAEKYAGLWRSERTHAPSRTTVVNGELRFRTTPFRAMGDGTFMVGPSKARFKYDRDGKPFSMEIETAGDTVTYTLESEWKPTADDLQTMAGEWYSEDADATVKFEADGSNAFLLVKNAPRMTLRPLYKDHFAEQSGQLVWFDRNAAGKITGLHIGSDRMRDMPFVRKR